MLLYAPTLISSTIPIESFGRSCSYTYTNSDDFSAEL
jgi:hypothetical protein